jgi:hypothetical protein
MNVYVTELGVFEYTGTGRTLTLSHRVEAIPCIVRVDPVNGHAPEFITLPDGIYAPDKELDEYLD